MLKGLAKIQMIRSVRLQLVEVNARGDLAPLYRQGRTVRDHVDEEIMELRWAHFVEKGETLVRRARPSHETK